MESRVRVARHPVHPMLVMFPTALLPLLLVFDALYLWMGDTLFWTAGFWIAAAGLATTLLAIAAGIPDMAAIPDGTRAHRTGVFHAIVGTTILLSFAASLWVRWPAGSAPDGFALAGAIDVLGVLLVTAQGWLGAELVYRHHIGVKSPAEGGDPVVLETGDVARSRRDYRGGPQP